MEKAIHDNQPLPYTEEDSRKFYIFIYLSMALAVITGVEIVIVWIPIASWIQIWTLAILSLVKFLGVIWWFMHMRWDRALIAAVFFLGFLIAGGTVTVLWLIFHYDPNEPVWEDMAAIEREIPATETAGRPAFHSGDFTPGA